MNSCDIAVIGGGAAGRAATRTVIKRGLSAICIEARDRVGGCAWTDSEAFGVRFDRGAAANAAAAALQVGGASS
jgi:monoamine oxidase